MVSLFIVGNLSQMSTVVLFEWYHLPTCYCWYLVVITKLDVNSGDGTLLQALVLI